MMFGLASILVIVFLFGLLGPVIAGIYLMVRLNRPTTDR